ncbi:hypothetical protein GCM10027605_31360 [Micromonospora zhanjiangensis]
MTDTADRTTAPEPDAEGRSGRRAPVRALFRRLFLLNGLVFTVGTLVLALSPATVSSPVLLTEIPVLIIGLAVILAANALLLRTSLAPLDALTTLMRRVDLLRTGDRLVDSGNGDLTNLIETFNAMLDRLERERSASSAHALAAQEGSGSGSPGNCTTRSGRASRWCCSGSSGRPTGPRPSCVRSCTSCRRRCGPASTTWDGWPGGSGRTYWKILVCSAR